MNDTSSAPVANEALKNLHATLVERHSSLYERLDHVATADDADAIVREMQEINFRIMMTGGMLFRETTEMIDDEIQNVFTASNELSKAISESEKVRDLIKATSRFLTLVDKVVDKIKLV